MLSPDIKRVDMFTGQGSQRIGMGINSFPESLAAAEIFRMADAIVDSNLSFLCANGPLEALTETKNAQPAISSHGLAARAVFYELYPDFLKSPPKFVAGHSAGEIPALVAAGVLNIEEGLKLSGERGVIMQQFGGEGSMAAVCGKIDLARICEETGVEAVNFNRPLQTVVSGTKEQIRNAISLGRKLAMELVKQGDEGNVISLKVSHPFHHSVLMREAQEEFAKLLKSFNFRDAEIPVLLNVTGLPSTSGAEIKEALSIQIASPVRWHESMLFAIGDGANLFIEFGPQAILSKFFPEINNRCQSFWVGDTESAKRFQF